VRDGLVGAGAPPKRVERFDACGSNAWVIRDANDPEHYAVASDHCRDRFCQACATERSNREPGTSTASSLATPAGSSR
jgi:hypothetical protein